MRGIRVMSERSPGAAAAMVESGTARAIIREALEGSAAVKARRVAVRDVPFTSRFKYYE